MVVFRPFASEVIVAKVKSSDQEGIRRAWVVWRWITLLTFLDSTVTVGFFDDIYIPASYLPQPCALHVTSTEIRVQYLTLFLQ
jgi:DNA-directed RNA polymerase III subunit RPC8